MGTDTQKADDTVLDGRWAQTVDLRECGVRIRKCRVKDIKLVTTFISIVAKELGMDTTGKITASLGNADTILQLISTCTEQVYAVCAALTDKDIEFLEDLDIDEGIKVVIAAYELNKRFFVEQVYPAIAPLLQLLEHKQNEQQKMPEQTPAAG